MSYRQSAIECAQSIQGWYFLKDLELLWDAAEQAPEGPFVEIGTLKGRSAQILGAFRKSPDLILCDINLSPGLLKNWPDSIRVSDRDQIRVQNIAFLHIDGGHDFDNVTKDLALAYRIVSGGILAIHDFYHNLWIEVRKAWEAFEGRTLFEPWKRARALQIFRRKEF